MGARLNPSKKPSRQERLTTVMAYGMYGNLDDMMAVIPTAMHDTGVLAYNTDGGEPMTTIDSALSSKPSARQFLTHTAFTTQNGEF